MAPKSMLRDEKGFSKEKKQERHGSSAKQESPFYYDFLKFQQQRSAKFQHGHEPSATSGFRRRFWKERSIGHEPSHAMTLWDQHKHEMYKYPRQQNSSFHYGFSEFHHQGSTIFQRVGPKTSSGVGARHQLLEKPSHNSVLRSYGMTLWDRNDFFNKKRHERYGSLARHQDSSSHCGFLQGSTLFQQHVGPKTWNDGDARHWFLEKPSPSSISRSNGLILSNQNEFFEEKKHERFRSLTRHQDSSYNYNFLKFKQQRSTLSQHGSGTRGGGAAKHQFPEEHGHGHGYGYGYGYGCGSRNMTLREDKRRHSLSRPNGTTFRSPEDPRHSFLGNASTTSSRTPSKRPIDELQSTHSHAHSVNTSNKPRGKDQRFSDDHDNDDNNNDDDNNNNNGKKEKENEREGLLEWKPLSKGNCSERLYTRGAEKGGRFVEKKVNEASEETRKRPRLNWGEGLAKFEKKISDKVGGVSAAAAAATPTSVVCNSLPGVIDALCVNAATVAVDNDVGNLGGSLGSVSQNQQKGFSMNSERIDANTLSSLSSSIAELLESAEPSSVDSNLATSNAISKLLVWKNVIAKVVETTEAEIDSLENDMKLLQSENGDGLPCSEQAGSLMVCHSAKSSYEYVGGFDKVTCSEPLQIAPSDEGNVEKMPLTINLDDMHDNSKDDDVNIPGTVSSCDETRNGTCSEDMDGMQLTAEKWLVPCTNGQVAGEYDLGGGKTASSSMEMKDGIDAHFIITSFYSSTDKTFCNTIISCNREIAERESAVFDKLSPKECGVNRHGEGSSSSQSQNNALIMEMLAEIRRYATFKEKILSYKYRAFNHLWKTNLCLQSMTKTPTSHRKHESSLQTMNKGCQKIRSFKHSRFPFPGGHKLSMVPTSDMINYVSQLLSEPKNEVNRRELKMPPKALILDQKDRMISMFDFANGLVEDPVAEEKERAMINPWTSEERKIFSEKFAAFGKDFRKIASFFDHKTTADCVEFYYKNHKPNCLEKGMKKKNGKSQKLSTTKTSMKKSGRKRNSKANVDSNKSLSKTPVMASGSESYRRTRSGRILFWGATDALVNMCGSLPSKGVINSFTTRSVDPVEAVRDKTHLKKRPQCAQLVTPDEDGIRSDKSCREMGSSEWTDEEKAAFLQAVSSFGENFTMIAQHVGTRSEDQCKRFLIKSQKSPRLDLINHRPEDIATLEKNVNGGRSDTDDACIVEVVSVLGTKTNEDQASSAMNLNHDESNPVEARNLLDEFIESDEINGEVDHDVNGGRDDACVMEVASVINNDNSGTKTNADQSSYAMNSKPNNDESNLVEVRNLSQDIDESKKINGEADHESVNMVSEACVFNSESKLDTDGCEVVLHSSDNYSSVRDQDQDQRAITTPDVMEIEKEKVGDAVTELVSASEIIEPCHSHSVAENKLVSEKLEALPKCFNDGDDGEQEADADVAVELKNQTQDSNTTPKPGVAAELPLLSQKIEQSDGYHKAQLPCSSDSEKTPTNIVVFKLFGNIITIPSPT